MDLLADLNEPQRQAVMHKDGPLLVLAGAGSGKTRVITRRIAYLIQQGVPPWQVLAITFTNKAAGEMRQRVIDLGTPHGATVSTFHALCARLLREFAAEAGLKGNFSIYDRADQLKMVKEAMTRLDLPSDRLPPAKVHATISAAKNELKSAQAFSAQAGEFYSRKVAEVYKTYETLLAANNAMDFDDLLLRMAFLMRDRADVRQALAGRYRYILIDEYQDTNHAQYLLAHGIAMEHENICATGDPDQSIYAWRGADINNILEFEQDYPNATVVMLEENYRSTAPILAAASDLIARNKHRKEKKLWTRREGGEKVRMIYCEDEHAEAREVARRIAKFRASGGQSGDVAVFYRVNSLSRLMEEALFKAGIPYAIARGVEFYNRKEIKDVLAYLRVLVNPQDDLSCERIINTPPRGIGATTVNRLLEFGAAHGMCLLESCRQADQAGLGQAAAKKVMAFGDMIVALAVGLTVSVKDLVEQVIERSGMKAAMGGEDEDDRQARANLDELISAAAEFDQNTGGTLEEYLHQVSLVSDSDHLEGAGGAVTLMTMHAAKGLEFPIVYIIGCEQGLLPFVRGDDSGNGWGASQDPKQLEEERRLAFVGITRAMQDLTLLCARRRMVRGQTLIQTPSQFLEEIGPENLTVLEVSDTASRPTRSARSTRGGFYSDIEDRQAIEDQPMRVVAGDDLDLELGQPLPSEYEYLKVGSRVRHPMFGRGQVLSLSQPWPMTRVKVTFEGYGVKTLVLAQSKLELV